MNIIRYEHHGWMVSVQEHLKGKHQEHCLCFRCGRFHPYPIGTTGCPKNCPVAQDLFEFDVKHGCTTPMWECPIFVELERFREYPDGTREKL
jgi:hypothetical protein